MVRRPITSRPRMKNDLTFLKPLVANLLQDDRRSWTVQGFGFLRTYFGPPTAPKMYRLNLWDHHFTVPNVSTIHDHPWDFTSVIIAGEFINQRYSFNEHKTPSAPTHVFATIKTGEGGGLDRSSYGACVLEPLYEGMYEPGDSYGQRANEIHETKFVNGSITLNKRTGDTEHARVFWPWGTHWVDAMPRPATREEVSDAVANSLRRYF